MNRNLDLEDKLKNMKPKPLTKEERHILWAKIQHGYGQEKSLNKNLIPTLTMFKLNKKASIALALIVVIIAGSGFLVKAADAAKPGDALFKLDLAAERVRLAFASKDKEDELRVKFASERLEEARGVVSIISENIEFASDVIEDEATSTENGSNETDISSEKIEKASSALNIALSHLENARQRIEERGNESALLALDTIIGELNLLAEEHTYNLDRVRARIGNNGEIKAEIKAANKELKAAFKLELDDENDDDDEDLEEKLEEQRQRIEEKRKEIENRFEETRDKLDERISKVFEKVESRRNRFDKSFRGIDKVKICHIPPGDEDAAHTIEVSEAALQAHVAHGDVLGECDEDDDDDNENDETAPVISAISSNPSETSASISWSTNENANSKVWYGTTTPLAITETTKMASSGSLVTSHNINISDLATSTTYYFIVVSSDNSGNTATSTESSFTTLTPEPADETPPVISGISAGSIATTSASISWNTDENANSKVWYGTTTPLDVNDGETQTVSSSALVTSHNLDLTSLASSTTYYYIVESQDVAENTATSSEFSFSTL